MDIIRLYVFNGEEHTIDEGSKVLFESAYWIMEKIAGTPVHRFLKGADKVHHTENPVYEEIFDAVMKTCQCNFIEECLTVNI